MTSYFSISVPYNEKGIFFGHIMKRTSFPSKERWLCGCRRAERSYSTFKVRRSNSSKVRNCGCPLLEQREEIPHVQGKRNPGKTVGVARGHQRADTLKP